MKIKSKEEDFQTFSHFMSCWHINEENCWLVDANTQQPLKLEEETSPLNIDRDKSYA